MASDEQRVRTMAGWIGVEISRSRVRTPGKAGYGLYRVRGSKVRDPLDFGEAQVLDGSEVPDIRTYVPTEWTAYAFELGEIETEIELAISRGVPSGPLDLCLRPARGLMHTELVMVPTRWTQAYSGKRNLGVGVPVAIKPEYAAELTALAAFVDEGLVAMTHVAGCMCSGTATLTAECVRATQERSTVKTRQRTSNAEFQAEHLKRRAHGLKRRHAAKLRLNERGPDGPFDLPS